MDNDPISVGIIGLGYFGPNLCRVAAANPEIILEAVADIDTTRRNLIQRRYLGVKGYDDAQALIEDPDVEAVVIATPPETHVDLALAAFESGKHVLVEKPLALNLIDASRMIDASIKAGRVLMVDHTFLYNPSVIKILDLIQDGVLGKLNYIDSVRINLGLFQTKTNVLWDLAPHDLSIVRQAVPDFPIRFQAIGIDHTGAGLEDVCYFHLTYPNNLLFSAHLSWLSPIKVRRMIFSGTDRSLIYDDLDPIEPVKVYDRGIIMNDPEEKRRTLVSYRTGDTWSPHIVNAEPLANMISHFISCIKNNETPRTDGVFGAEIVCLMEQIQQALNLT